MEGVVYKKVDKEVNKEVHKEVDEYETYAVEVKWEVDEVAKDVSIFRMRLNVFYWNSIKIGESFDSCRRCAKFFSCRKSLKVHMITTRWKWAFCM